MATLSHRLGAGVPDLAALGARSARELIEGPLETEGRAELVARDAGSALWRLPLPGTPDEWNKRHERPRGAGTGHVYLRRYDGAGFVEALRARFGAPRSDSLAAREWNLLCHLRAHGVATPEPMALAWEGSGFARRSALVTRALEGMVPIEQRLAELDEPEARRELAAALRATLERALEAGVWLPRLAPRHLFASAPREACSAGPPVAGMSVSRLPEVALASVRGGRLRADIPAAERARWLARFEPLLREPAAR